jgi:glutamate--cysteine ligase
MAHQNSHERQRLLRDLFERKAVADRIGIEVELGVLDPETGISTSYQAPNGLENLLQTIAKTGQWERTSENCRLMALNSECFSVQLEHGGAVEYSSRPVTSVRQLVDDLKTGLRAVSEAADRLRIAIVPGGNFPFNTPENTRWVPKARGRIMRDYFEALGHQGAGGLRVMSETLSTQITLDYDSEADMGAKMRTLVAIAPIATAIFANSPLDGGRPRGALSRRAQHYFTCDPQRCGFVPPALGRIMTFDEFIDWAQKLPMIYRATSTSYEGVNFKNFATVLEEGFADGTSPNAAHWRSHLSQIYTDVRLRETIEIRAVDGTGIKFLPAIAAFWSGLVYHPASLAAAWDLVSRRTIEEHWAALKSIPTAGLAARPGPDSVCEIARELLRLAKEGVRARVNAGLEDTRAVGYFEPLEELLDSGVTLAERCLREWHTSIGQSAAHYVAAYRILTDEIEAIA